MDGVSVFHLIVIVLVWLIVFFPVIKILQKAGYSGWWILIWFVPGVNIIFLWLFAFADWPNLREPPVHT